MLDVENVNLQNKLANLLRDYKDVCPANLPLERMDRGIWDVHEVKLKPDAKPESLPPYR